MKIVCPSCGKKYNYEKHMGICPACTKYTSFSNVKSQMSGQAPVVENENDGFDSGTFGNDAYYNDPYTDDNFNTNSFTNQTFGNDTFGQDDFGFGTPPPQANTFYQSSQTYQAPPVPKKPKSIIPSIVIVVLMIAIGLIVGLVLIPNKINELYDYQKADQVYRETWQVSEPILFGNMSLVFHPAESFDAEITTAPEGWKYICIPFDLEGNDYSIRQKTDVFLEIDGAFIKPMVIYNFSNYDAISADEQKFQEVYALNITDEISSPPGGNLVFLIPEEKKEYTLKLYLFELNEEYGAQKLEDTFEIKMREEG